MQKTIHLKSLHTHFLVSTSIPGYAYPGGFTLVVVGVTANCKHLEFFTVRDVSLMMMVSSPSGIFLKSF